MRRELLSRENTAQKICLKTAHINVFINVRSSGNLLRRVFTSQKHSTHTCFVDATGVREVNIRCENTSQKISGGPTIYENVDIGISAFSSCVAL